MPVNFEAAANELVRLQSMAINGMCGAWLDETGLLPSESVACTQTTFDDLGTVTVRTWVEKRKL